MKSGDFVYIIRTEKRWNRRQGSFVFKKEIPGRIVSIDGDNAMVMYHDGRHHLERGRGKTSLYKMPFPLASLKPRQPYEDDLKELWTNDERRERGMEERERNAATRDNR